MSFWSRSREMEEVRAAVDKWKFMYVFKEF